MEATPVDVEVPRERRLYVSLKLTLGPDRLVCASLVRKSLAGSFRKIWTTSELIILDPLHKIVINIHEGTHFISFAFSRYILIFFFLVWLVGP